MNFSSAHRICKGFIIYILRPIPDRIYLSILYYIKFQKFLRINHPKTFNEKLQWLKLNDRNPLYTILVDKIRVKDYVARIIGEAYVIPIIGIWESPKDIDYESLPKQFVLKWNHDSGSTIICTDKNRFDKKAAQRMLAYGKWINGYYPGREWAYKNVPQKVFAEKYICPKDGTDIINYRFYMFQGNLKGIFLDRMNKQDKYHFLKYKDYAIILESTISHKALNQIDEMIDIAKKLARNLFHVRIDLYNIDKKIYFGEYTFYDGSGFDRNLSEYNGLFDNWLILPTN